MTEILNNKELQSEIAKQVKEHKLGELWDIENIDFNSSIFPLAPGWWVLIAIAFFMFLKWVIQNLRLFLYKRTYRYEVYKELSQMQQKLSDSNIHESAKNLAETIKCLKMHTGSRSEIAKLTGKDWLKWLTENEENKFNWQKEGANWIESIYAPKAKSKISMTELNTLINQVKSSVEFKKGYRIKC